MLLKKEVRSCKRSGKGDPEAPCAPDLRIRKESIFMRSKKLEKEDVKISFRLPADLIEKIDNVAESLNMSRSNTIRLILKSNLLFEMEKTYANKKRN